MKITSLLLLAASTLTSARLLVDYTGGQPASVLGSVELEGNALGCKISSAGLAAFIKPEPDSSNGVPSLHFKRDPHFRRAEVKALGKNQAHQVQPDRTYYIGYHFRLSAKHESLVIFQWKKWDKNAAPKQNIPLYMFFDSAGRLVLEYTTPGGNGSNRDIVWTGPALSVGKGTEHHIALAINTAQNGRGWLELYVDGVKQRFNDSWGGGERLTDVELFTGATSPKFGIYRAEAQGGGEEYCPSDGVYDGPKAPAGSDRIFNSWIYRVQISDSSLEEIAEAGGL